MPVGPDRSEHFVWIVVDVRRCRVGGWWVTEKYGRVCRRRWCLHAGSARVAFVSAQAAADRFMSSLVGVVSWQAMRGHRRVEPWC